MRPLDLRFDDDGWFVGALAPTRGEGVQTLFAVEKVARFDAGALGRAAARAFGGTIQLEPQKHYRAGAAPIADAVVVWAFGPGLARSQVIVTTFPVERALDLRDEAVAAAVAAGGGGMDALVARARRVLQVVPCEGADANATLAVAAALAETELAAIHTAQRVSRATGEVQRTEVIGPKTAKSRLAALGLGPGRT